MPSNFPLIRVVDSQGMVYYAPTFNWNNMGVQTGKAVESVEFTLPLGFTVSGSSISVVASGIASDPQPFVLASPYLALTTPRAPYLNQTVEMLFSSVPTGNTFTLTFDGQTTAAITYSTVASTLQSNIQAGLAGIMYYKNVNVVNTAPTWKSRSRAGWAVFRSS